MTSSKIFMLYIDHIKLSLKYIAYIPNVSFSWVFEKLSFFRFRVIKFKTYVTQHCHAFSSVPKMMKLLEVNTYLACPTNKTTVYWVFVTKYMIKLLFFNDFANHIYRPPCWCTKVVHQYGGSIHFFVMTEFVKQLISLHHNIFWTQTSLEL